METAATLQRGAFPLFAYLNVANRDWRTTRKPLFQAFPTLCAAADTDRSCIKDGMKIDPAVGQGELLIAMIKKVIPLNRSITVVGYETDATVAEETQEKISKEFPDVNVDIRCSDFLEAVETGIVEKFDFVIANPPYIRTQIMGSTKAQQIAEKLELAGRVDIYYAFLIYTKNVLKEHGVSGYITSNKFMTIKAGVSVRNYMLQNYEMHQITDLGDTKLFTASVLPCIMIFSLGNSNSPEKIGFTSVYEEHGVENCEQTKDVFEAIYRAGHFQIPDGRQYHFQQGHLKSCDLNELWTIASKENEEWLDKVESNTWMTFSNIGKVRVGIKTTADNVFIGDDWNGEKADIELLRPLITHRNAGQIVANHQSQWKVLYTHTTINGKKVAFDIDKYPNSKEYLLKHYEQLSGRNYVLKAKRNWYANFQVKCNTFE